MSTASLPVPTFYQMKDFAPESDRLVPKHLNSEYVHLSPHSRVPLEIVMRYFQEFTYERTGVLYGEYALVNEVILIARDGLCIKANMAWEDPFVSRGFDDYCRSSYFFYGNTIDVTRVGTHFPLLKACRYYPTPTTLIISIGRLKPSPKTGFFKIRPRRTHLFPKAICSTVSNWTCCLVRLATEVC